MPTMKLIALCVLAGLLFFSSARQAEADFWASFWLRLPGPVPSGTNLAGLYAGPPVPGQRPLNGVVGYDFWRSDTFRVCWFVAQDIYCPWPAQFAGRPDTPKWFHYVVARVGDELCQWVDGEGPLCETAQPEGLASHGAILPAEEDASLRDGWVHDFDDFRMGETITSAMVLALYEDPYCWSDEDLDWDVDGSDLAAGPPDLMVFADEYGRRAHHR